MNVSDSRKISNEATMLVLLKTVMRVLDKSKEVINLDLPPETKAYISTNMIRDALGGSK